MKFLNVCLVIFLSAAIASAQYFGNFGSFGGFSGFSQPRGYYGLNAVNGDFGLGGSGARDSRQDRGPVVFPASPEDGPVESSGVVVGASGYGFVPPNGRSFRNYRQFPGFSGFY